MVSIIVLWVWLPIIAYIDMRSFENPTLRQVMASRIKPEDPLSIYIAYLRASLTEVFIYTGSIILAKWYYGKR